VTRGQLPQRAGSLGLNGGWTATAVPPYILGTRCGHAYRSTPVNAGADEAKQVGELNSTKKPIESCEVL